MKTMLKNEIPRGAWFVIVICWVFSVPGVAHAQYDFNDLFQFSEYWQQPVNETNFGFNLEANAEIDENDFLRLLEGWRNGTSFTPILPPPAITALSGIIELATDFPFDTDGWVISAAGGEAIINASGVFSELPAWDEGAGQFVFVESATGSSLLIGYVEPEDISSGTVVLTTQHVADALIALHPVTFELLSYNRKLWMGGGR